MPMMLPAVWPWKFGPDMPVGMRPAMTVHCSGPPTQPVVVKLWTEFAPVVKVAGPPGLITQLPVGAGGGGGGLTAAGSGVQPDSFAVAVGVRPPSETVIVQSG